MVTDTNRFTFAVKVQIVDTGTPQTISKTMIFYFIFIPTLLLSGTSGSHVTTNLRVRDVFTNLLSSYRRA